MGGAVNYPYTSSLAHRIERDHAGAVIIDPLAAYTHIYMDGWIGAGGTNKYEAAPIHQILMGILSLGTTQAPPPLPKRAIKRKRDSTRCCLTYHCCRLAWRADESEMFIHR